MKLERRRARLAELAGQIRERQQRIREIHEKADRENRTETREEFAEISNLGREIEGDGQRDANGLSGGGLKWEHDQLFELINREAGGNPGGSPGGVPFDTTSREGQPASTLGSMFVGVPAYREFIQREAGAGGVLPGEDGAGWRSPRITIGSFFQRIREHPLFRDLFTGLSDTQAGAMITPDFKPILDSAYKRPLAIRDLITVAPTTSDLVSYVRVTGVTNNAAVTPEATGIADGSGAAPMSSMALERINETVKDITHYEPATANALSDAGQTSSLIDDFLRYGIEEKLENEIVSGPGTGDEFRGILATPGRSTQAWDTDFLTTTRKARTKVRTLGRAAATAYGFHPIEVERMDLLKDDEGRYYWAGSPWSAGPRTLWGVPVAESEAIPQNTSICAAWRLAILWDRMQSAIYSTNSHSDHFIRRIVAMLAVYRGAFGVVRPAAFVETDMEDPG